MDTTLVSLKPLVWVFLSYVLSFVYIGLYWNNHHHMMHGVKHVNGAILWANLHLLFLAVAGSLRHGGAGVLDSAAHDGPGQRQGLAAG